MEINQWTGACKQYLKSIHFQITTVDNLSVTNIIVYLDSYHHHRVAESADSRSRDGPDITNFNRSTYVTLAVIHVIKGVYSLNWGPHIVL